MNKLAHWLDAHLPWKTLCIAMAMLNATAVWYELRIGHGLPFVNIFVALLCTVSAIALWTGGR